MGQGEPAQRLGTVNRACHNADRQCINLSHEVSEVGRDLEHLPVRSLAAGMLLATVVTFTGTLSYALAANRPQPAAAPVAKVAATSPAKSVTPAPAKKPTVPEAPAQPVRRYIVQPGDSLWEVASRYGITLGDLLSANPQVDNPGHVQIGQELLLPPTTLTTPAGGGAVAANALPSPGDHFAWPVLAPISSPFGPRGGRNHNGLDLAANTGDPIKAARDGEVVLSGWVQGYGETVILKHEDGTQTLYGHCSRRLVQTGERVRLGEVIAEVGSTGNSTGPHLHFEIIVNNKQYDPLLYLPKR